MLIGKKTALFIIQATSASGTSRAALPSYFSISETRLFGRVKASKNKNWCSYVRESYPQYVY